VDVVDVVLVVVAMIIVDHELLLLGVAAIIVHNLQLQSPSLVGVAVGVAAVVVVVAVPAHNIYCIVDILLYMIQLV
jgi:hypothetical protein